MKMKFIMVFSMIFLFFLLPVIKADTTFFDNPNDFFIISGTAATGGATPGITGRATGGTGCKYEWNCTDWGECLSSGTQIRNCINTGTCPDVYNVPVTWQNCSYTNQANEGDNETKKINWIEIADKNKIFISSIITIILIVLFAIFYLRKKILKKPAKKVRK
jgi:hypothetical protein